MKTRQFKKIELAKPKAAPKPRAAAKPKAESAEQADAPAARPRRTRAKQEDTGDGA